MLAGKQRETGIGVAFMHKKILIMGLPGAGKTTLSEQLAPRLNAVHFNADDVRANINKDLGFSEPDRIEHARRMGWLCDQVVKVGCFAIADFICPTPAAREAFLGGGERLRDLGRPDRGRRRSRTPTGCSFRRSTTTFASRQRLPGILGRGGDEAAAPGVRSRRSRPRCLSAATSRFTTATGP